VVDRVRGCEILPSFKQFLRDKLIEHKEYVTRCGEDLPEIRNWQWK